MCIRDRGKDHLYIPHAILSELGIPTLTVFDNDSGCTVRMEEKNKSKRDIRNAVQQHKNNNRAILRYFDVEEEDYPEGLVSRELLAMSDTLESIIDDDWPEWNTELARTIASGRGVGNKNAATYALVSENCSVDPSGRLQAPIAGVRSLINAASQPQFAQPREERREALRPESST